MPSRSAPAVFFTEETAPTLPSNHRIHQLEEDNSRLRKELELLQHNSPSATRESLPTPASTIQSFPRATETVPDAVGSHFHGPTSVIFDSKSMRDRRQAHLQKEADAADSAQLLGEAAKQRQMESINLRQGKLDFDGIDPKLAMNLLSLFWNRQHAIGSIVYRPSFMRDMATNGPYFSRLLLNAMYFVASEHAPNMPGLETIVDCSRTGLYFRRKAEAILYGSTSPAICTSSITTIQALLLISDGLFSWCDERSLSWHCLGIATNMIIDLGLHSENSSAPTKRNVPPEELEVRRRLFWAAFVLDKVQSIYQGRPARLRDMDCNVPMVFMDSYEELEPFDPYGYILSTSQDMAGLPTHSVSTFQHMCALSTITDRILCGLYTERSATESHESLCRMTEALQAELDQWKDALPPHLIVDTSGPVEQSTSKECVALPHTLSLLLMYYSMVILLYRPFVSEGHLRSSTRTKSLDAFSVCESAALEIDALLRFYRQRWCIKSPPYFVSYATYVSATIHVRLASQKPPGSQSHVCLQDCLDILGGNKVMARAPMQSIKILRDLAKRLNVHVNTEFAGGLPPDCCDLPTPGAAVGSSLLASQPAESSANEPHGGASTPTVSIYTPNDAIQHSNSRVDDTAATVTEGMTLEDGANLDLFLLDSMTDEFPFDFNFECDPLFGFVTH